MTACMRSLLLACGLALLGPMTQAQSLIESYRAEIDGVDRRNSSGVQLSDLAAILTQDRANVHRFNRRQAGDTLDSVFSSREMRAQMPALIAQGGISASAEAALRSGGAPLLDVSIWGRSGTVSHVTVELANTRTAPAQSVSRLSDVEMMRDARRIQSALNARGFDAGPVDGQPGRRTRDAIAAFQRSLGTPPTGQLTRSEYGALTTGSPAAQGPSFDCDRASTPTEFAICGNPELAAMDRALATAWQTSDRPDDQAAWLQGRDACGANADCIRQSMQTRVLALGGSLPRAVSVTGAGSFSGVSPDEGTSTSASVAGPGLDAPRLYVDQGRIIGDSDDVARRLAMLAISENPALLDDPSTLAAFRRIDIAKSDPRDTAFRSMNAIEKEDALVAFRAKLIAEANATVPVSPESPLAVAAYVTTQAGDFVEGMGLSLGETVPQVIVQAYPYPVGSMTLILPQEIVAPLPMTREEAAAFIDRVNEERASGRMLRRVVWGHVTRIGRDESIESFATAPGSRGTPTTFIPTRAGLYFVPSGERSNVAAPIRADAEPVHVWSLGAAARSVSNNPSALQLAQSLGLPTRGEALDVPVLLSQATNVGWSIFTALTWLGQNPEAPREGNGFIGVAMGLLPDAQHRSFFGRPSYSQADVVRLVTDGSHSGNTFPDEFARRDAKRVFFENYYDGILARTPEWPVQVRHSMDVRLGPYDFETESFPIDYSWSGVGDGTMRVVSLPDGSRGEGAASAERFGNLPDRLPMLPDEARVLRQIAATSPVQLVWSAEFDQSIDTSAVEEAFGSRRNSPLRTGQGTLRQIGIFAGPDLDWAVMPMSVEEVLLPVPEIPEAQAAPVISEDAAAAAKAEPSEPIVVAAHIARIMGEGGFEAIAALMPEVQAANEFDAAAAMDAAVAQLRSAAQEPLVVRTSARLGSYDLEQNLFPFGENGSRSQTRVGSLQVDIEWVGPDPFAPLSMDMETARYIAEQQGRRVTMLANLTAETIEPVPSRTPHYKLLVRPERVIYYTTTPERLPRILAERRFDEANAAAEIRMARRFEASEFEGLADARLDLTTHVADLIAISDGYTPTDEAVDRMATAAWAARDSDHPGPSLFDTDAQWPQPVWLVRHRPMIRSWLGAKAKALGRQYTANILLESDRTCGSLKDPIGRLPDELLQMAPQILEDANALNRMLRERKGPVAVARRNAVAIDRPDLRPERCANNLLATVLIGAIHEGLSAPDAIAARVEFDLMDVARSEGQGALPNLTLTGRATATRLVFDDGAVSKVLSPEPDPVPEPDVAAEAAPPAETPGTDQTGRDDPAQAVVRAMPPPPAPQTVSDWPDIIVDGVEGGRRDLLGLAPGQRMEDAAAILAKIDGVEAVFETATPLPQDAAASQRALGYQRIYLLREGAEALTVASWSPEGEVVAIMRRIVIPQGVLPYDRIFSALTEKYGTPEFNMAELPLRGWGGGKDECHAVPFGMSSLPRLVPADGGDRQAVQIDGTAHRLGVPSFDDRLSRILADCPETLIYMEERPDQFGHSGFSVLLMDFERFQAARSAIMPEVPSADAFEIEF